MSDAIECPRCASALTPQDVGDDGRAKCPFCRHAFKVKGFDEPEKEIEIVGDATSPFDHDRFLIRQKMFSIDSQYIIRDDAGNPILYALRKTHLFRTILAIFAGIVIAAILMLVVMVGLVSIFGPQPGGPRQELPWWLDVAMIAVPVLSALAVFSVFLWIMPKRHITFFLDEARQQPILAIRQENKFFFLRAWYSVYSDDGELLGRMVKNYLYNLVRKQWWVYDAAGQEIAWAREDSILLALMRRFLGNFYGFFRTNFVIDDPETGQTVGTYNRKFTLYDSYALDLSADVDNILDRRLAVALGVLLDTGEHR